MSQLADELPDCPFTIKVHETECETVQLEDVEFNDNAEPTKFVWRGCHAELESWLNTPYGAMSMFEARRHSPVLIWIEKEAYWLQLD